MLNLPSSSLDAAVHLIQVALTPVFLLSGIAALLNVFAGRLARVADRLDHLTVEIRTASKPIATEIAAEITALHKRSVALDAAVVLGSIGAAAICLNILTLFVVALSDVRIAGLLLLFFGIAILCTLASVAAFVAEMLMSGSILRARMQVHVPTLASLGFGRRSRS
jgi:hypothetical protein